MTKENICVRLPTICNDLSPLDEVSLTFNDKFFTRSLSTKIQNWIETRNIDFNVQNLLTT